MSTCTHYIEEYGDRKSCAVTCAKRLGAFLGGEITKDKGLCCQYIITTKPVVRRCRLPSS